MKKWVYFFGAGKAEGNGEWRDLLGGKGAGLAEMTKIGLPVPAGFTISTEACDYYYKNGKKYPPELKKEVAEHVARAGESHQEEAWRPEEPAAGERALRFGALHAGNDGDDSESGLERSQRAGARGQHQE